jgi:hypothetical protein
MKKSTLSAITVLIAVIIYLSFHIIRLESYHYAAQIGFCSDVIELVEKDKCLDQTETRTSPIYHLLYGLEIL